MNCEICGQKMKPVIVTTENNHHHLIYECKFCEKRFKKVVNKDLALEKI